jgi:hypothetical protein
LLRLSARNLGHALTNFSVPASTIYCPTIRHPANLTLTKERAANVAMALASVSAQAVFAAAVSRDLEPQRRDRVPPGPA